MTGLKMAERDVFNKTGWGFCSDHGRAKWAQIQKELFSLSCSPFLNLNVSYWFVVSHLLFFPHYPCTQILFFLSVFLFVICASKQYFQPLFLFIFLFARWHTLAFYLSLPLSPITCNNHTHFLPSAASPRRPWAAGCWLASVLMIWRSWTQALGINGLCHTTTGPLTHTLPHTQMPRVVIDGQWESQPLQT